MVKFQEQDHTSIAPTSDIPINNHLTISSSSLSYSALLYPETRSCNIASPEHIQTFVCATSGSTHLIMDFVSLSPLDNLSDEIRSPLIRSRQLSRHLHTRDPDSSGQTAA